RVSAHESIQHGFLGRQVEGSLDDITKPADDAELVLRNTERYNMDAVTSAALSKLCPPAKPAPTPGVMPILRGGGGGREATFWDSEYPSWWYSMWGFVAWVHSIPIKKKNDTEPPKER